LDGLVTFLRNNRNIANGIDGEAFEVTADAAVFQATVAKGVATNALSGLGDLRQLASDALPGLNRIDTQTATHALQIKQTRVCQAFSSSQFSDSYLDDLSNQ
jgi:hypothetical protein